MPYARFMVLMFLRLILQKGISEDICVNIILLKAEKIVRHKKAAGTPLPTASKL